MPRRRVDRRRPRPPRSPPSVGRCRGRRTRHDPRAGGMRPASSPGSGPATCRQHPSPGRLQAGLGTVGTSDRARRPLARPTPGGEKAGVGRGHVRQTPLRRSKDWRTPPGGDRRCLPTGRGSSRQRCGCAPPAPRRAQGAGPSRRDLRRDRRHVVLALAGVGGIGQEAQPWVRLEARRPEGHQPPPGEAALRDPIGWSNVETECERQDSLASAEDVRRTANDGPPLSRRSARTLAIQPS